MKLCVWEKIIKADSAKNDIIFTFNGKGISLNQLCSPVSTTQPRVPTTPVFTTQPRVPTTPVLTTQPRVTTSSTVKLNEDNIHEAVYEWC